MEWPNYKVVGSDESKSDPTRWASGYGKPMARAIIIVIFIIFIKFNIAHMPDGKINRQIESKAHKHSEWLIHGARPKCFINDQSMHHCSAGLPYL